MIGKIGIFFGDVLLVWGICMKIWYSEHPKEAVEQYLTKKYPKWFMAWICCIVLEVVLAVASLFWFLFLR